MSSEFAGFDPAHTTPIPNALIDELLTVLSWDELKVMLYIIRRTSGFNKPEDTISLTQFTDGITTKDGRILDKGCGVKNRTRVSKILKALEQGGYIEIERPEAKTGLITYRVRYSATRDATVPSQSSARDSSVPSTRDATVPTIGDSSVPSARYAGVPHNKQLTNNSKQKTVRQKSVSRGDQEANASPTQNPSSDKNLENNSSNPGGDTQSAELLNLSQQNVASKPTRAKQSPPEEEASLRIVSPPAEPPPDMAWGTKKCLLLFDFWRGAQLIGKGTLAKASQEAKGLASQYGEEQVRAVYKMMDEAPYWKARGGVDIFNVTANIAKEIRKIPNTPKTSPEQPAAIGMNEAEARQLVAHAISVAKGYGREIHAIAEQLENGMWCVSIGWSTQYVQDMKLKTAKRFFSNLQCVENIWLKERKVAVNG